MALNFEKYAEKGNLFLKTLAEELGEPENTEKAGRVLRSFFRSLRKLLTIEESLQMLAQLPMALKGIYVDGWKPAKPHERIKHLDDFVADIMEEGSRGSLNDYRDDDNVKIAIYAVFKTLSQYVSPGEMMDMAAVLPGELRVILENAVRESTNRNIEVK